MSTEPFSHATARGLSFLSRSFSDAFAPAPHDAMVIDDLSEEEGTAFLAALDRVSVRTAHGPIVA